MSKKRIWSLLQLASQICQRGVVKRGRDCDDAGYNKGNMGDVDYEACLIEASAITPVPGGPGPVTISYLIKTYGGCC